MENNKHISYLDLANVICAIAVVILHANGCFWYFSSTADYWPRANIIECLFYFAVPIFYMISGITLIDYNKRYSLKEYFKKRINKTVVPYLFWSFISIAYSAFYIGSINPNEINCSYIISKLFTGTGLEIYSFFIPLFSIYLAIPLLSAIDDKYKKSIFIYFTVTCFIFNALIPFIIDIFNPQIEYMFNVGAGVKTTIFATIGYLLHNYKINKKIKYSLYSFAIIALLAHIIGTYVLSMEANEIVFTYKNYSNVPSILFASGVFLLIKENGEKIMQNKAIFNFVNFLRKYTFGIYLLHIYFLRTTIKMFNANPTTWLWIIIMPFVAIIGSIVLIKIIRQIPILKRFIP